MRDLRRLLVCFPEIFLESVEHAELVVPTRERRDDDIDLVFLRESLLDARSILESGELITRHHRLREEGHESDVDAGLAQIGEVRGTGSSEWLVREISAADRVDDERFESGDRVHRPQDLAEVLRDQHSRSPRAKPEVYDHVALFRSPTLDRDDTLDELDRTIGGRGRDVLGLVHVHHGDTFLGDTMHKVTNRL